MNIFLTKTQNVYCNCCLFVLDVDVNRERTHLNLLRTIE